MQIEIDFHVFKSLTALRRNESDSYNDVLRRILKLPEENAVMVAAKGGLTENPLTSAAMGRPPRNALAAFAEGREWDTAANALLARGGWFDNVHFPEGTLFRATYKGQRFTAEIRGGCWVGSDGVVRTSPSAAAGAISNTTVNGWRFWYALLPGTADWRRLDEFKQ